MRDVWKSALEWYIYLRDTERKTKYAVVIMAVKDRLSGLHTRAELVEHYMNTEGLCESVVAEVYPGEAWLDMRQTEDVAYGLRCLELTTGKQFDLIRQAPSRLLIETVT
jgi:hypothetical protein